jgi:hypothetical protein
VTDHFVVRRGIVRERRARESPRQRRVRRHRTGIVDEHGANDFRTYARSLRHRDGELCAWTAVLMAHGRDPGGGGAEEEPRRPRTRVDHVAQVAGVEVRRNRASEWDIGAPSEKYNTDGPRPGYRSAPEVLDPMETKLSKHLEMR